MTRRDAAPSGSLQAIAYHDGLANGWSARYAGGGFRRRADFFIRDVLPRLAPRGEWIDVGCGSGVFSRILAQGGASVYGVDGSSAMIAAAEAAPSEAGARPPRYSVGTVETLTAANERFDGALCLSVLEYLDDPSASLATLARLLRPGGTLVLSAPNRRSLLRFAQSSLRAAARLFGSQAFAYLASSRNAWSRRELIALATAQGLTVEAIVGFDPVVPRPLSLVAPSLWFAVCRKAGAPRA